MLGRILYLPRFGASVVFLYPRNIRDGHNRADRVMFGQTAIGHYLLLGDMISDNVLYRTQASNQSKILQIVKVLLSWCPENWHN